MAMDWCHIIQKATLKSHSFIQNKAIRTKNIEINEKRERRREEEEEQQQTTMKKEKKSNNKQQ